MRIIADYREKPSGLIELLKRENIEVEVKKISHGDYVINDSVTIERKTARDFIISIIDGRLFGQLSGLKKRDRQVIGKVNPITNLHFMDEQAALAALYEILLLQDFME